MKHSRNYKTAAKPEFYINDPVLFEEKLKFLKDYCAQIRLFQKVKHESIKAKQAQEL